MPCIYINLRNNSCTAPPPTAPQARHHYNAHHHHHRHHHPRHQHIPTTITNHPSITQTHILHRSEENYFFALSKYQAQLEQLLEGSEDFVQPASRRNEVLGWVREGVRDFSISRSAVAWGIPMRQDPEHTVYVWFDALNGYLSGLLPLTDAAVSGSSGGNNGSSNSSSSVDTALQQGWPADVHVIGKDILRFHAIYWPGMLMSAGLPLPKQVRRRSQPKSDY